MYIQSHLLKIVEESYGNSKLGKDLVRCRAAVLS